MLCRRYAQRRANVRGGAALVEFAFVLPVVLLLIVGAIDIGRALAVQQALTEAARAAARLSAVRGSVTEAEVQAVLAKSMGDSRMTGYTAVFEPPLADAVEQHQPVTVTVAIPFSDVSLLPRSWFMEGATLRGVCVMPADLGG
jgi:Flp pilus assembly protein TadG